MITARGNKLLLFGSNEFMLISKPTVGTVDTGLTANIQPTTNQRIKRFYVWEYNKGDYSLHNR
jgi:hypothetical protein